MFLEQIKQKAKEVYQYNHQKKYSHDRVTKTTPLERALLDATSNENWTTPTKLLQEIADATYNYQDFSIVMRFVWDRLMVQKNKNWRKTFKVIYLIEFLLKNGAPRCIGECKDEIYQIKQLTDYQFYENSIDRGEGVREKIKAIIELLQDEQLLEQERENAKKIREKLTGVSCMSSEADVTKFSGYGSKNQTSGGSNSQSQSYKGYGGQDKIENSSSHYDQYEFKGSLDKYRKKDEKPEIKKEVPKESTPVKEEDKKAVQPAQLMKLPKPGEKGPMQVQTLTTQQPQKVQQNEQSLLDFDEPQQVVQPPKQQTQQNNIQQWQLPVQETINNQQEQWEWQNQVQPPIKTQQVQQTQQQQAIQLQQAQQVQQSSNLNQFFLIKSPQQLEQQAQIYQQNTQNQTHKLPQQQLPQQQLPQQQLPQQQLPQQQQMQPQKIVQQQPDQDDFDDFIGAQEQPKVQSAQNNFTGIQEQSKIQQPPKQNQNVPQQQTQKPAQQPKKNSQFNDFELDLVNLSDLKKEEKTVQKPKQSEFQMQNNLLHTKPEDLDNFNFNMQSYNQPQNMNYFQYQNQNQQGFYGGQQQMNYLQQNQAGFYQRK